MRDDLPGRPCSIAAALNLIGEKWAVAEKPVTRERSRGHGPEMEHKPSGHPAPKLSGNGSCRTDKGNSCT